MIVRVIAPMITMLVRTEIATLAGHCKAKTLQACNPPACAGSSRSALGFDLRLWLDVFKLSLSAIVLLYSVFFTVLRLASCLPAFAANVSVALRVALSKPALWVPNNKHGRSSSYSVLENLERGSTGKMG